MTVSSTTGVEPTAGEVPLGLLELDSDGTVLYHKVEQGRPGAATPLIGRNLFAELRCAENVGEFQRILHAFAASGEPARSFDFTFHTGHGPFAVRVLLARMREQTEGDERALSLVHIRRA